MFDWFRTLLHYRSVAKAALEDEEKQGKKPKLRRDEREFQAAAIEIIETPPSPLSRVVAFMIMLLFTLALVWAFIGRIDIFATLQGKIVPVGNVKVIEPLITGKVTKIHVTQGQKVKAGDLLIELDPTEKTAERARLEEDLFVSITKSARLKAVIEALRNNKKAADVRISLKEKIPDGIINLQQTLLTRTLVAHEAELLSINSEIKQKQTELIHSQKTVEERDQLVKIMSERVAMLKNLEKTGSGSRAAYLERAQVLYEQRADLATERGRLAQLETSIETLKLRKKQKLEEQLQKFTEEFVENERRVAGLRQEVIKATTVEKQSRLYAPVNGRVQQLAVHTKGDVLTTGQQMMIIVPEDTKLEIEAMLLNKDKGFVKEGQTARVKVETFNFTKYGIVPGKVIHVSNNSVSSTPQQPGQQTAAPVNAPLVFPVRIELEKETLIIDGKRVRLSPGMSVTTEIKTGNRRIIEFLLSPLLRIKDEALRER